MSKFYSPSTKGFYCPDVHDNIPSDAVEITTDKHHELLSKQRSYHKFEIDEDGGVIHVPKSIKDGKTLDELATALKTAVSLEFDKSMDALVKNKHYSDKEQIGFSKQETKAIAWLESCTSAQDSEGHTVYTATKPVNEAAFLRNLAARRLKINKNDVLTDHITLLSVKIIAASDRLGEFYASVLGVKQHLEFEIDSILISSLSDSDKEDALLAIDISQIPTTALAELVEMGLV